MFNQNCKNAPKTFEGKFLNYEETFRSPFERDTSGSAMEVLEAIRSAHDKAHGWVELEGYIEKLPNGKYRAVRRHAQYK